jgi:hypothetical protein
MQESGFEPPPQRNQAPLGQTRRRTQKAVRFSNTIDQPSQQGGAAEQKGPNVRVTIQKLG